MEEERRGGLEVKEAAESETSADTGEIKVVIYLYI